MLKEERSFFNNCCQIEHYFVKYRTGFMTRAEYEEHGEGYLKEHMASNKYTPTPPPPEVLNPTPPTLSS